MTPPSMLLLPLVRASSLSPPQIIWNMPYAKTTTAKANMNSITGATILSMIGLSNFWTAPKLSAAYAMGTIKFMGITERE